MIGKKTVESGKTSRRGSNCMAIVPLDDIWVTANFKETQLQHMRVGPAGDHQGGRLRSRISRERSCESRARAARRFSLLPPENATGNFVKVVQRIPVRIALDPGQNEDHLLRPGMSVVPSVQHSMSSATTRRSARRSRLPAAWKPKHNPWAIALAVTLATFMEVLDTSIANVALPHIAGNLSAGEDESTWVLSSYLVANAVVLPISAWLATRFGRKRFYMTCVVLFGVSSLVVRPRAELSVLVFFRVLQGLGGGGLAPSEQAILADTFPPQKRGMAFAVYGMAVVLAPAIGPTLGG